MPKLNRRVEELVEDINQEPDNPVDKGREITFHELLSTGSTLLDLAISGGRAEFGGIPGGILLEIFGESGCGKTAVLAELAGCAQSRGGKVLFNDPEARLDKEYAEVYGVNIEEDFEYRKPDTVTEAFEATREFLSENVREDEQSPINIVCTDSNAALSTDLEMDKGDKMGMRRAKEFSQETRKSARLITNSGNIVACSNQVRQGDYGDVTPGGKAIPYYSSLRIQLKVTDKIRRERTINGVKHSKIVGIRSVAQVVKSSIDEPYRTAPVIITFGYGVDDVRGSLEWIKSLTKGETKYELPNGKRYGGIEQAIQVVENEGLEEELRKDVRKRWLAIQAEFVLTRKPRKR